ncbi:DUF3052 family protein [bacterium]|nr:DUF3052 family protein [bacterium]
MGLEALCTARFSGKTCRGKARLETDELTFRGEHKLTVPLSKIDSAKAEGGKLVLRFQGEVATLDLGAASSKWAEKITNPKRLIDKLDLRPGARVAVLGVSDPDFLSQLGERTEDIAREKPKKESDAIFLGAETRAALSRLGSLSRSLGKNGALWVVRPRGSPAITESEVMEAGHAAGLVDTKVVRFSATHTAEKFVIPLSKR